jgi:hypothetical protein
MTITITEALGTLQAAIEALLPIAADPALTPEVRLQPLSFHPVGVGGVLGHTLTVPRGELHAKRIAAQLVLRVKAANQAGLTAAEATASAALVGADPVNLRTQGIFKLRRAAVANPNVEDPAGAGRDVHFDVLFEYRKLPSANEGVIDEVVADSVLRATDNPIRKLFSSEFQSDPLSQFTVFDDPAANGAGDWQYDAQRAELLQVSSISGGSDAFDADKAGTALVLRPAVVPVLARNFVLWASMRSDVGGGIGLVFRYLDAANHYFFLMNHPQSYRLLARKLDSQASFLDGDGSSPSGYQPGVWNLVRLSVQDQDFEIAINGAVALRGQDAALDQAGSVGFLCRNNSGARFRLLRWLAL